MSSVKLDYPGLLREPLPSGAIRWRVRVEGRKTQRVTLNVNPEHHLFREHYYAARAGIQLPPPGDAEPSAIVGSVGWLVLKYVAAMQKMYGEGQLSPSTLNQRTTFLEWLRSEVGEYKAAMPQSELVKLRDKKSATPGAADNFIKAVRAMYVWAIERGHLSANPAKGIAKLNTMGTGAAAWTLDDLAAYRKRHPAGTMAHLALTLFMFTAARIGDVYRLGRAHEVQRRGVTWLDFQPAKKGAKRVRIPMLPPLLTATRAMPIVGKAYVLNGHGQPFASENAFGSKFRQWCDEAGLEHLSSHGVRKAAGELLALEGASQYHIMAVHGHSSAKTSEIYTRGVDRDELAAQAMALLGGMDW